MKESEKKNWHKVVWKHPVRKTVIVLGRVYGMAFLSKYFMKASSEALKACKEFNSVLQ